jgi:hypothetical protein
MTLWVRAFGAYRAEIASGWRSQDYLVRNLVKSLKGEQFKGYSDFKVGEKFHQINAQDNRAAYYLWSNWAGVRIRNDLNLGKVALVPVPSSSQTQFVQDTCPVRMANSVAALIPQAAVVGNFLRHKTAQPKAHSEGGTRDADQIAATLACRVTDTSLPVVLIDDVMSTGGHLKACAQVLREHGLTVEHVLLAGRTVWEVVPNPYSVPSEDIEDVPDFDAWLDQ